MPRRILVLFVILFFVCAFASALAESAPFRHADRNKDGVVDRKEVRMEKAEHRHWLVNRSRVNTVEEAKYDANGDGWLEPAEAKQLLKDKYELIRTRGRAKVDTAIEAEYDTNKDGILDKNEAEEMFEDIK